MTSTWSNERIINFINEVHLHPELSDVETGIYKDRNAKKDGWAVIAEKFGVSSEEAYKKFRSLRTYAKKDEKKRIKSGSAGGKLVKWFAFDAISFILSQDTPNTGLDSKNPTDKVPETLDTDNPTEQEGGVDLETTDSLSLHPAPKPRTSKRSKTDADPIIEKAKNILREAGEIRRNECSGFGEHIANKLCKYDAYTRAQAEWKIMEILQRYRKPNSPTGSSNTPLQSPSDDSRSGASTSQSHYSQNISVSQSQNWTQNALQPINNPQIERPTNFAPNLKLHIRDCSSEYPNQSPQNPLQHIFGVQYQDCAYSDQTDETSKSAYEKLVSATIHQCDQ